MTGPIMLYDGVCNLCNSSVRFVLKRDKAGIFRFAALQSAKACELLEPYGTKVGLDTIYLIENGRLYDRSSAALRIMRRLRFPWPLMTIFLVVPKPLRDIVYNWIGRNRYRWFGHTDACQIPDAAVQNRFLDQSED
jgi:predicted DCC family thiol-disulfide oxidoreductase YuxK